MNQPDRNQLRAVRRALYAMNNRTWYTVTTDGAGTVRVSYKDGPTRSDALATARGVLGPDAEVTVARALTPQALGGAQILLQEITGRPIRVLDSRGRIAPSAPRHLQAAWAGRVYAGTVAEVLDQLADVFVLNR